MARIDEFFRYLIANKGSDLHLSEGQPPKIRVHGAVVAIPDQEILAGRTSRACSRKSAIPKAFERYLDHRRPRLRLRDGRGLALPLQLPQAAKRTRRGVPSHPHEIASLESLGVPAVVKEFGHMRSGLVLVTGPTGSGKSTTLAALFDYININFNRHIITVEEPIEFVHSNKKSIITQREVPIQTPSFADGLRAALREDSDIVLVGEMRDLETISLALTAAETGLLVFGTLHTNNARKTVDRIIDVFPSDQQSQVRTMLAASLRGVVAQLLCKRVDKPGRTAVHEIMFATPAVSAIIREGATQKLYDVITGGKTRACSSWTTLPSRRPGRRSGPNSCARA
jgi:twitching motility protein PilT